MTAHSPVRPLLAMCIPLSCLIGGLAKGGVDVAAASIEVASEKALSTRGSTRGTAYSMSNKIVTLGDKTHVAWLDTKSATMIQTFDHSTDEWLPAVHVGSGKDNHGGPALVADSKGYLHIVFGPHGGPFQYCRSERPNDASSWLKMPEFGDRGTYPSLICGKDDTLYIAYRGGSAPCKLLFQRKPAGGEWTEPVVLVDAAVPGGYTQYSNALCFGPDGTIHLAFHVYDLHPAGGKAVGHLQSRDGGVTWTLADGSPVELPYTPHDPGWVVKGPELDMRCANVDCDPDGNPYLTVSTFKPSPSRADIWRFVDGAWERIELAPLLRQLGYGPRVGAEPLCFDGNGNLYVALTVSKDGKWGDPTNEVLVLYSEDRGEHFQVLGASTPSPEASNWLPSLERRTGHNLVSVPHLLYTHGGPGEGCTPPDLTEIRLVKLRSR